jgi:putative FmdB family regulatory protein
MPIYEYKCSECGNIFEILTTSSNDEEKVQCDKCESERVKKVISAGSFRLTSGISSAPPAGCAGKSGFS